MFIWFRPGTPGPELTGCNFMLASAWGSEVRPSPAAVQRGEPELIFSADVGPVCDGHDALRIFGDLLKHTAGRWNWAQAAGRQRGEHLDTQNLRATERHS